MSVDRSGPPILYPSSVRHFRSRLSIHLNDSDLDLAGMTQIVWAVCILLGIGHGTVRTNKSCAVDIRRNACGLSARCPTRRAHCSKGFRRRSRNECEIPVLCAGVFRGGIFFCLSQRRAFSYLSEGLGSGAYTAR
jgi:hypothetical protein